MSTEHASSSNQGVPIIADGSPHLTLIVNEGTEKEASIKCRRAITLVGSRDGCKITLRHDRVSQVHAAIVHNGTQILVVDLLSRTGTLVNGLKVDREILNDGDTLQIGPWTFRVIVTSSEAPDDSDVHPFGLDPSPHVVALEHKHTGQVLKPNRSECTIGRLSGCDIAIDDQRVSRCHAIILSYFGQPAIADLLSRNQTLVNDTPVAFRMLSAEDIITVGETSFVVRMVNTMPDKYANNGKTKSKSGSVDVAHASDLIDIKETEGSQRWRVADKLDKIEKVARKA